MDRRNALLALFVPLLLLLSVGCRSVRHVCGDMTTSWEPENLETSGSVEVGGRAPTDVVPRYDGFDGEGIHVKFYPDGLGVQGLGEPQAYALVCLEECAEPAGESTHALRIELAGTLESFDERLDDEDATRDPHDRRYGWHLKATNDAYSIASPKIAIDLRVQSRLSWTSDVYCD
jgi:hypothetical protein